MSHARISLADATPPLLSLARVSRRFPDGERQIVALDGVSLELDAGAVVGVYGARRSGKSTLLRIASAIESPDAGTVRFEGRDVTRISARRRAELLRGPLALLAADGWHTSPGETVLDHVAMSAGSDGLTLREARRRAHDVLERVGAAAVRAEEMTASLSLREHARVMLARALVREPRLLLVDEPAPMPSLGEREEFCALLRAIARERRMALLLASEDMSALQGVDTLLSLSVGELCSAEPLGTVVELPLRRTAGRRGA
jgi:putative ABC transport system ATP-binding protein